MNGPDHYREAERLLVLAEHWNSGDGGNARIGAAFSVQAQAHATLAVAAATWDAMIPLDVRNSTLPSDQAAVRTADAWDEVTG